MRALFLTLLFWGATLSRAEVSVKDTVVNGIPSIRFVAGPGAQGDLKIAQERGVWRASLEGASDSILVVFDRNPFAQMMGRTRPLIFPPRVTKTRLVMAKSTARPLLRHLALNAQPPAPVAASAPPPVAPPPSPPSAPAEVPAPLAPLVSDASPETDSAMEEGASEPDTTDTDVSAAAPVARPERKGSFTVVIDAGHGGKDPGAIGKLGDQDVMEKMATLQVARKLRDELGKHPNIKVVMTRDKDVFLELAERTRIANTSKGDLFVSLHCNSLPLNSKRREEVKGFMVYLLREAKDENDRAIERRENEAIRFETGERAKKQSLGPVEWMMLEHQLNLYTKESERLAELVVRNLSRHGPVEKERTGAGQAGFFVLVGALMPSVLIEMGYVSSAEDAATLTDPARQKRIAAGIAKSIEEFRKTRR
jgi:N-acetylmuramoyl-L-alanine amidase